MSGSLLFNSAGAKSDTKIEHDTSTVIGNYARVSLIGDNDNPGTFLLSAKNDVEAEDREAAEAHPIENE